MMVQELALIDAQHKELAYFGLAQRYAAGKDSWLALHAQTMVDMCSATVVAERHGLDLPSLLERLNASLTGVASVVDDGSAHPATVLTQVRALMKSCLPDAAAAEWEMRVNDLSINLEGLPPANAEVTQRMLEARLGGMTVEQFIDAKREGAKKEYSDARAMRRFGKEWDAVMLFYSADLAEYEAWTFEQALRSGDEWLVQAQMRWALAVAALEEITALPEDVEEACGLVRSRLVWAVGPAEAEAFAARLV